MFLACLYPTKWNAFRFWASFPFLVHIVWLYFAHDVGLCGFWIDFPEVKHTWDFRAMSYTHLSHVQQHTKENSLSSIWIWIFAVCFLALNHPTADDYLIVAVWLLFRDAIIPQPWSRHAKFMRREMVIYGGDWTEIMVVIVTEWNMINRLSVHCHLFNKPLYSHESPTGQPTHLAFVVFDKCFFGQMAFPNESYWNKFCKGIPNWNPKMRIKSHTFEIYPLNTVSHSQYGAGNISTWIGMPYSFGKWTIRRNAARSASPFGFVSSISWSDDVSQCPTWIARPLYAKSGQCFSKPQIRNL